MNKDPFDPWSELPAWSADEEEWLDFKSRIYGEMVEVIRTVDLQFADDPRVRVERLRELRREHHLIVIADRVRRESQSPRPLTGKDLRLAAEFILDRSDFIASGIERAQPRSRREENMLLSARVNWHKLMRQAGARAELRGGWHQYRGGIRGGATLFKKIASPELTPKARGRILRDYINDRVEQLLDIANEAMRRQECALTRRQRLIIRDLEGLRQRTRNCVRMEAEESRPATAKKQPEPAGALEQRRKRRHKRAP